MYGEAERYADYDHPIVFHNTNKTRTNQCWLPEYNDSIDLNGCNYYYYQEGNGDVNMDQRMMHEDIQGQEPEGFQELQPGHGQETPNDGIYSEYIDANVSPQYYGECNSMHGLGTPDQRPYSEHAYQWSSSEGNYSNNPPIALEDETSIKTEPNTITEENIRHPQSLDYSYIPDVSANSAIRNSPGTLRFLITEAGYLHLVAGDKQDSSLPFFRYTKLPFDFTKINTQHARHLAESLATDASLVKEWILARSSYQSRKKISVYLRCGMHKQCKFRVTVTICPPTFSSQQGTIVLVPNGGHSNNIKSRTRKFS